MSARRRDVFAVYKDVLQVLRVLATVTLAPLAGQLKDVYVRGGERCSQ